MPVFGAVEPIAEIRARLSRPAERAKEACVLEGAAVNPAAASGEHGPGFYLEDDSGGILVWTSSKSGTAATGDRLRVTGKCFQADNTRLEMEASNLELLPGGGVPLKPRRLFPDEAQKEEWQNTLADVDGVVSEVSRHENVEYIWLRGVRPFRATYPVSSRDMAASQLEPGMRVILRGILGPQPDSKEWPRPQELVLRSNDDLVIVDAPITSSRQFIYLFLSLGVLAGVWIVSLQRAVHERTQALKEALRKAEEGSRMKSTFVANMSHEIRTPLNAIIGFSDLLIDGARDEEKRILDTIRVSANSLLDVINDVLDFSKIESGKLDLSFESASPRSVIEDAIDVMAPAAAQKGLDLGYLVEEGVPARVVMDPVRLRQILMNLLSNAVKFTDSGYVGVSLRAEPEDEAMIRLYFAVKDTGIGIPGDQLERLFRPFHQLDDSVRRRHGGTGLGLVISRHLVRLMHGDVYVGSTPGEGSVFTASLLCHAELSEEPKPELPPGAAFALEIGRPWTRTIIETLLRRAGAKFVTRDRASTIIADRAPEKGDLREGRRWVELSQLVRVKQTATGHVIVPLPLKPSALWKALLPPQKPVPATEQLGHKGSALRILVADDNAVNVKVVTSLLSRLGHPSEVATNGKEVLAAMDRQAYDLIFLDIQMPEMDGLEAARRIRQQEHLRERPWLVALTANAMSSDRDACLAAGMNDHVAKPIGLKQLAAALERAEAGLLDANPIDSERTKGTASGR